MNAVNTALQRHLGNRYQFISGLQIIDQHGRMRHFNQPHAEQRYAMADFLDPRIKVVNHMKPRQIGNTLAMCAALAWLTYNTTDPVRALIAAHVAGATDNIFQRIRMMLSKMPRRMRRPLERSNRKQVVFRDTLAGVMCETAGGKGDGRSYTYQILVAEEQAYWKPASKAEAFWASVRSTQHDGPYKKTWTISTSNGPGNLHHQNFMASVRAMQTGDPSVRVRFFRWSDHDTYRLEPPPGWEPTEEEYRLAQLFNLDAAQLYWRHYKLYGPEPVSPERFRREYPLTLADAFAILSGAWFDVDLLSAIMAEKAMVGGELRVYRQYDPERSYVAGIDPSWCVGGDYFAMQILDDRGEQVCVFHTNTGGVGGDGLTAATERAAAVINHYRCARVLVEENKGGGGKNVVDVLRAQGIKVWRPPRSAGGAPSPFTTGHGTREEILGFLRSRFNADALELHDVPTLLEMQTFRFNPDRGAPEASGAVDHSMVSGGGSGVHDDLVMALALALHALKHLPRRVLGHFTHRSRRALIVNPWATGKLVKGLSL